jgi:hypothetical protein
MPRWPTEGWEQRPLEDILAEWRAAEERVEAVEPGTPERIGAEQRAADLAAEYRWAKERADSDADS